MTKPRLVLVEWEDSAQPLPAWRHIADAPALEVVECVSVGWVVAESERVLMLAPNLGDVASEESGQASGFIRIPRSCISRMVELVEVVSHT